MQRFRSDRNARDEMNDLLDLASVFAGDFAGAILLYPRDGGRALESSGEVRILVEQLLSAAKPVAAILQVDAGLPYRPDGGILIIGSSAAAPQLAADALVGAIQSAVHKSSS